MKVIMGHRGIGSETPGIPFLATRKGDNPKTIYLVHYYGAVIIQSDKDSWHGDGVSWARRHLERHLADFTPLPCGTQLLLESMPMTKGQKTYLDEMNAMYRREERDEGPRLTVASGLNALGATRVVPTPPPRQPADWWYASQAAAPQQAVNAPQADNPLGVRYYEAYGGVAVNPEATQAAEANTVFVYEAEDLDINEIFADDPDQENQA